jgi:hypothetical protein
MHPETIAQLLRQIRTKKVSLPQALERLKLWPFEDLGFATIDHQRHLRQGLPEVILGTGKTAPQVEKIAERLLAAGAPVLATRLDEPVRQILRTHFPRARENAVARAVFISSTKLAKKTRVGGRLLIISAGTADQPVAEEAAFAGEVIGLRTKRAFDVGVAGLHRFFAHTASLRWADVIIVVAGMEGALPSVVGGVVGQPVIAVPTSVGYGTSFGGLTALFAMLNSCAAGVTVVNIDNGFGAAFAAWRILQVKKK